MIMHRVLVLELEWKPWVSLVYQFIMLAACCPLLFFKIKMFFHYLISLIGKCICPIPCYTVSKYLYLYIPLVDLYGFEPHVFYKANSNIWHCNYIHFKHKYFPSPAVTAITTTSLHWLELTHFSLHFSIEYQRNLEVILFQL